MKIIKTIVLCFFCQFCYTQNWQPLGTGLNISATKFFTDTVTDKLYVGGPFTRVDGDTVWGIASWNGSVWDSLGHGINRYPNNFLPDNTWGMAHLGNYLYIGGSFDWTGYAPSPFLSRWDGTNWSSIPGGQPNDVVDDVIVYNNELYICGVFDSVGNVPASGVARWDGSSWYAIGGNYDFEATGSVLRIQFFHGNLYIGGVFQDPLGNTCRLAKWDGSTWQFFTNEVTGGIVSIFALKEYNNELYISGLFYAASGNAGNCIMRWNDTTFQDVGGGVDFYSFSSPQVRDMVVNNGKLYCAGSFEKIGGIMAYGLASWDGVQWCGYNTSFQVNSQECGTYNLDFYHDTLYVGGGFRVIDGDTMYSIAKWIGGSYVDTCGTTTGVEENLFPIELIVFPNPTSSIVTFQMKGLTGKKALIIYDQLGKEIWRKTTNENQIEFLVEGISAGLYFYRVEQSGIAKAQGKFIIQ